MVTKKKLAKKKVSSTKKAVKKTVVKKPAAKKKSASIKKLSKKKMTKKSSGKKKLASKKQLTQKKVTKKSGLKKKTAKNSPAKKKIAKKSVTKKKTAKKLPAKKKIAKKSITKKKTAKKLPAKKKITKKSVTSKKIAIKKPATSKELKNKIEVSKKGKQAVSKSVAKATGKANLLSLKSKVFRRNTGDVQSFTPYSVNRGEEFMNSAQVEHFRKILLDWKRLLMEEVDRTVHHMQDEAANFPDPNDRATQEEEFALELRTRDRERKLIRKIDEAILRLNADDFGYCEVCGVDIGIKRLEARPTATLCIDCKTLDEIKEKQLG